MELIYTDKDGNQTKYTQDMITAAIDERNRLRSEAEELKDKANQYFLKYVNVREKVTDFFKDRFDTADPVIRAEVEDVNELLESIGGDRLMALFTVTGTISFTITDVEAGSEDEAREMVENELSVDFNGNGSLDDWDVEVSDTTQQ